MNQPAGPVTSWQAMLVELIRNHARLFFRLAYHVLRDAAAAEDVCQQAFLKAWEQKDRIRDSDALRAWLARVVVNESLQVARRRKSEARVRDKYRREIHTSMNAQEQGELRDVLYGALAELSEQTRAVVVLRLVQRMPGNEVKSLLGCSASEVSRRLHQGMEHLRGRLAEAYAADSWREQR